MAEEVKPETIKKTQVALNKYIKKPPLTDKLLKKPPFRFLHDIITSVIRETGFLDGVFTADELIADNVKDRDSKVKFLTKLINAVKQATGNQIKAKPGKIVAGLEADKTLELLQAIAKGISVKSNGKKAKDTNQKDKKSKETRENNQKNDDKEETKNKGKLKEGSPAASLEKQPSREEKGDGVQNGEQPTGGEEAEAEEEKKKPETDESKRSKSSTKPRQNGEIARKASVGGDERSSDGPHDRSSARIRENGEKEEVTESDRRSRRRNSSSARAKDSFDPKERRVENGEVEDGDLDRRSGRRRERSSTRENGGQQQERSREGRSGRRRESSASLRVQNGEIEEGRGPDPERKSARRNSSRDDQQEPEQRLLNGLAGDGFPPEQARRKSSLRKSISGESQEKIDLPGKGTVENESAKAVENKDEKTDAGHKRPQTKRTSSRSSKGPLKAFADKAEGELKEEEETKKKAGRAEEGPSALGGAGSGPPAARPPSAKERPRTARRAPPGSRPASGRPPSGRQRRPPSALPGAPRARDRGEVHQDNSKDQTEEEIKEVVVITENEKVEDKEDMVIVENPALQLNEEENIRDGTPSVMEGVLIDSILETQLELEKRKSSKAQVDIEWEGGKGRAAWEKECSRLREGVQGLTRAAGPLGKLFDFLQEDVDLAARELATWRKAGATFALQLAAEQRLTEETLSRHRKKLRELETLIEEQHEAVRSLKSAILANDRKIQTHISRFPAR